MIQSKAANYNRQDNVLTKLLLGFMFSPLVILLAFAAVIAI